MGITAMTAKNPAPTYVIRSTTVSKYSAVRRTRAQSGDKTAVVAQLPCHVFRAEHNGCPEITEEVNQVMM